MKRRSALVLAVTACLSVSAAGVFSSASVGASILLPSTEIVLAGKASPSKLSKTTPKPITLTLNGKISQPGSEERPPVLTTLSLQFDKDGAIFTRGLAICEPPHGSPDIGWGPHCPEALVGRGEAEIDVQVPEEPAFRTEAPMEIFNGAPQHGRPVLIYKVVAKVPAPTTYIATGVIEEDHGKFGTQTTIKIPTMLGGDGSITGFRAKIGKTWTYMGHRVSLFTARCPKGTLIAHAEFDFADGFEPEGTIVNSCD